MAVLLGGAMPKPAGGLESALFREVAAKLLRGD
jgi:hypothetical protein